MSTTEITSRPAIRPVISLTDEASNKVAELIAAEASDEELGLRIAVRAGGCSGFSCEMFFDPETNPDDHLAVFGTVTVKVDSASSQHLDGATLTYSDGIQGAGFSVENPNPPAAAGAANPSRDLRVLLTGDAGSVTDTIGCPVRDLRMMRDQAWLGGLASLSTLCW